MKNKFIYTAIVISAALSALAATEGSTCVTQDDPPGAIPCQCLGVPVCDQDQPGDCYFPNGSVVSVTCICNGSQEQHTVPQCSN